MTDIKKKGFHKIDPGAVEKQRNGAKVEYMDGIKMTPRQIAYLQNFLDKKSPTYFNSEKSVVAAGYNASNVKEAAKQVHNSKTMQEALKASLKSPTIDRLLQSGILHRLQDPDSKNWQPTADFVAKIRGDFAPEKHEQTIMTQEQRDRKFEQIEALVGEAPIVINDEED